MPPEYNEQARREIIGQLEQKKARVQADQIRRNREQVEAVEQSAQLDKALRRAKLPFPSGDICPECWINHGIESPMVNEQEKPLNSSRDRFICRRCPYTEMRSE